VLDVNEVTHLGLRCSVIASDLRRLQRASALHLRSVCWFSAAFLGLECHPLALQVLEFTCGVRFDSRVPPQFFNGSANQTIAITQVSVRRGAVVRVGGDLTTVAVTYQYRFMTRR